MTSVQVSLQQISATATEATIRHHTVLIDRPIAKEGTDKGAMGGELLLASLGGCFMSNLLEVIRTRQAPIEQVTVRVEGTLETAPQRFSAITLFVSAHTNDEELLEKLVRMAERACLVANTLKQAVSLTFMIEKSAS